MSNDDDTAVKGFLTSVEEDRDGPDLTLANAETDAKPCLNVQVILGQQILDYFFPPSQNPPPITETLGTCWAPGCDALREDAECIFCILHCEWRWATDDAPLCKVHWDKPQRCKTPHMFCQAMHSNSATSSCIFCRAHCYSANCTTHNVPAGKSATCRRGTRAQARQYGVPRPPPHPPARRQSNSSTLAPALHRTVTTSSKAAPTTWPRDAGV